LWDRKYLNIGRVLRKAWILNFRVFVGLSEMEVRYVGGFVKRM
jgi:hypothetical protein